MTNIKLLHSHEKEQKRYFAMKDKISKQPDEFWALIVILMTFCMYVHCKGHT